jgi:N-acetylglucosamine kinase-like BadF-type ATPase
MKYVFGIDGGGTSARLRIESIEGRELFYGEGGSTNPNSNSWEAVEAVLRGLFARAYAEAGLRAEDCAAGFAGSAGVDRPADKGPFSAALRRASGLPESCPLGAGNDAEPALAGAIGDIEGLLLIAGTGSIAYARTRAGDSARAGGLGHLLGDEGSAYRISFDAIARSLRSIEERDLPTGLMEAALPFFGLKAAPDFIPFIYSKPIDKKGIARFARVVGEYRDRGDPLAVDLFETAARELESLVLSVYRRLGAGMERRRLALRGGLIEGDSTLRSGFAKRLSSSAPDIEIVSAKADASAGACLLARHLIARD